MGSELKRKAVYLRKQGWSYNIIADRLKVNKSTLNGWLKDIPYRPNATVLKRIKAGPLKSGLLRHAKKLRSDANIRIRAQSEVGALTRRDLFMLGIGLYIGEGTKRFEQAQIVNADPNVLKLAVHWFRLICNVPTENFRLTLHVYPDTSITRAITYWSQELGISPKQFGKTYLDRRTNKSKSMEGKLPYGTVRLAINGCGNVDLGVNFHRRILGWIESVYNKASAGIV